MARTRSASSKGIEPKHERTAHRAVRHACRLVGAGILLGVPCVLIVTRSMPSINGLGELLAHPSKLILLLNRPLDDTATVSLVRLVAWLAWVWLVLCVSVELVAQLRGRPSFRLPASGHLQSVIAFVVGASLAIGGPNRSSESSGLAVALVSSCTTGPPASSAIAGVVSTSGAFSGDGLQQTVQGNGAAPSQDGGTYVVRAGDTLWSIAAEQLGSPLDWRLIADLNYGRPQPDGGQLLDDHWIRPGWIFELPPSEAPAEAPAESGLPTGVGASGTGSVLKAAAPVGVRPRPVTDPLVTEEASRSRVVHVRTVNRARTPEHSPRAVRQHAHVPVEPIGFGLLGAGIVALIDRMRRAQQRLRPTGLRIALPSADVADLERGLRLTADPGAVEWVDLALRLLSALVRRNSMPRPPVVGLRVRPDAIELMLDRTGPTENAVPPEPFALSAEGTGWLLRRSRGLLENIRADVEVRGIDDPMPALVTLGQDEWGLLMVDLETAGSLAVIGSDADAMIQGIAVELATADRAEQVDVVVVGFDPSVEGLERVSQVGSVSVAFAKMQRRARERRALLDLANRATNSETRWAEGGDAWDLSVVLCSQAATERDVASVQSLVDLAADGSLGIAAVCVGDHIRARWRARAHGGRVRLEGRGLDLPPVAGQPIPPDFARRVGDLVSIASQTAGASGEDPPYDSVGLTDAEANPVDDRADRVEPRSPEPEVEVCVLGRVEVHGARPFTRAWAMELVVYLAMHRGGNGVRNEQWATALWPDRVMAPATLHSTASAARRSLGVSASGDDHLPRAHGRLALGPGVRSDWDRFMALARSDRPEHWQQALELIRGRPFDELRAPDWVLLEGILASVEAAVVDVASRLAEHCLLHGDPGGAEWAARQGLRVSSYDERLYRVLLRTADASGNPAGVEAVMAELLHLVAEDVEPFDAVHPETFALYRELSRRSGRFRHA